MPAVYFTDAARDDLRTIAFQVGLDSGSVALAERIVDTIADCCEELAALSPTSRLGTAAPGLGQDVRLFSFRRWVILFRYAAGEVVVLRIADGAQNYMAWNLERPS